jgi:hypothetical protein
MDDSPGSGLVRVGDSERERAILRLREAVVEGRLTLEEFTDRVGRAYTARTDRDLAELTDDLPALPPEVPPPPLVAHRAIFSSLSRGGPLSLARRTSVRSLFGTVNLDLREARLSGPEVDLEVRNTFGTVTVLVPVGVEVRLEGGGLLSSEHLETEPGPPVPGAPLIRIHSSGLGGTLHVRSQDAPGLLARMGLAGR